MLHLVKYSILVKVKDFNMVFWPLVFPILMATMFYFSFGRITEADFETISVAVVLDQEDSATESQIFIEYLKKLEQSDEKLICIEEMSKEQAKEALDEKKISGIFYVGNEIRLAVSRNGLPESILQSVLESYENGKQTILKVAATHPEGMHLAMQQLSEYSEQVKQVSLGGRTLNGNVQFFYALIAMACLYGAFIGLGAALSLQANLSSLASRQCVSPTSKLKRILSEMCSSFILHYVNVWILLLYIRYVLRQEFGGSLLEMMLVVLMGCIIGVSMGIFVGSISRLGEGAKGAILLGISMSSSFFAGLMNGGMKNVVEQHAPIINRLNPAALITDAFYCVNVYEDRTRYIRSLLILGVIAAVLVVASFAKTRRERYDSI